MKQKNTSQSVSQLSSPYSVTIRYYRLSDRDPQDKSALVVIKWLPAGSSPPSSPTVWVWLTPFYRYGD